MVSEETRVGGWKMVSEKQKKVTPLQSNYIEEKEFIERVRVKRRRGLTRRLAVFFIFVAVATVTMTSIVTSQAAQLEQKKKKEVTLEEQLTQLEEKEQSLQQEVKQLNDLNYIGEIARRDYYMSEKGEIIFTTSPENAN
jgi:cell division protein DivIC